MQDYVRESQRIKVKPRKAFRALRGFMRVVNGAEGGTCFDAKSQLFKRVSDCMTLQNQRKDQHNKSLDLSSFFIDIFEKFNFII